MYQQLPREQHPGTRRRHPFQAPAPQYRGMPTARWRGGRSSHLYQGYPEGGAPHRTRPAARREDDYMLTPQDPPPTLATADTAHIAHSQYFSRYKILFHFKALLWESSILLCPRLPAKPTLLQYDCMIIAQYTPPHRRFLFMPYTIQYW